MGKLEELTKKRAQKKRAAARAAAAAAEAAAAAPQDSELLRLFERYDVDGDGALDSKEVSAMVVSLGYDADGEVSRGTRILMALYTGTSPSTGPRPRARHASVGMLALTRARPNIQYIDHVMGMFGQMDTNGANARCRYSARASCLYLGL